ncbi:MAG: 2-oxoacid:acceptor oxidoreductase subunit alpha [Candidatus Thorarchaeota archaeon]
MDISFNIGGEAGQGIDTIGDLLTQIFVKQGFYTFTSKDFMSRIRGGYNFNVIRVSDKPVFASLDTYNVIVALTEDAIREPRDNLSEGGVIIFDESIELKELEACHFSAPLEKTAKEIGGDVRMMNAAALGAVLSVLKFPFKLAEDMLTGIFSRKGEKVVESNIAVAKALYDLTNERFSGPCSENLSAIESGPCKDTLMLTGNQGVAFGAMAANVKWVSSYPMSPSTSVFIDIISNANKLKIGTIQSEDEISAILMAIGASYGGARAMTTTSGGGFALMVEALGFAAMSETPVIIYNAQRPGPSTGLPTRTEQADLLFSVFASQGEFPRIILAPKDPVDGFDVTVRAFNLSEKFQVPVMILGDQYFADSVMNLPRIDVSSVKIDRGSLADENDTAYKRYLLTNDGVSPRAFPGTPGKVVVASGNVHLENGHITENAQVRDAMVHKFMNKIPFIMKDMQHPTLYGAKDADITLLTWGSSWGAAFEAMQILSEQGTSINLLHFTDIYPMRDEILKEVFARAKKVVAVEQNALSQFAKLVRMEVGLNVTHHVNRYDGRPMTARWIIEKLKEVGAL